MENSRDERRIRGTSLDSKRARERIERIKNES